MRGGYDDDVLCEIMKDQYIGIHYIFKIIQLLYVVSLDASTICLQFYDSFKIKQIC